jgi:hypothetical protein
MTCSRYSSPLTVAPAIFAIAVALRLIYALAPGSAAVGVSADAQTYHDLAVNLGTSC